MHSSFLSLREDTKGPDDPSDKQEAYSCEEEYFASLSVLLFLLRSGHDDSHPILSNRPFFLVSVLEKTLAHLSMMLIREGPAHLIDIYLVNFVPWTLMGLVGWVDILVVITIVLVKTLLPNILRTCYYRQWWAYRWRHVRLLEAPLENGLELRRLELPLLLLYLFCVLSLYNYVFFSIWEMFLMYFNTIAYA